MKKILLFIMSIVAMFGVSANAAIATGSCGSGVTFSLNDDQTLVISGNGDMANYEYKLGAVNTPWANHASKIRKVKINDGVTSIADYAFWRCGNLQSVTIGNSVKVIGSHAFDGCSALNGISIPASVTAIRDHAFSYCKLIPSVTIPTSVKSIGDEAFQYCIAITSIAVPKSVTELGQEPFSWCTALKTLTVDPENPAYCAVDNVLFTKNKDKVIMCVRSKTGAYSLPNTVKTIGYRAFWGCPGLTSIEVPNSVTSIEADAFYGCM